MAKPVGTPNRTAALHFRPSDTEWMLDGDLPCHTVDPELFFPESAEESRRALLIIRPLCAKCPVRLECVQRALDLEKGAGTSHVFGIWGGLTSKERQALRRHSLPGLPELI